MLGITSVLGALYFIALSYLVIRGTLTAKSANAHTGLLGFAEACIDLVASVSKNPLAFFFALVMNFVLIYGIFGLNLCSIYLADLATSLE